MIVPVSPATQIPLPFVHTCTDKFFAPSHPLSCLGREALKLSTVVAQVSKIKNMPACFLILRSYLIFGLVVFLAPER